MRLLLSAIVFFTILATIAIAQYRENQIEFWNTLGHAHIDRRIKLFGAQHKPPKNVIFFLGDGMGLSMVTAGRISRAEKDGYIYHNEPFAFEKFDFAGLVKTASYDFHTTDSAAGAMALFTGHKVEQNSLGRLPGMGGKCAEGENAHINDGIAELALAKGMSVGVVTTTKITDATPAANYAKGVHRQMDHDVAARINGTQCTDIAQQILRYPANKFAVLMGGGKQYFTPKENNGLRGDQRDITKEWKELEGKRTYLSNIKEFNDHEPEHGEQVLGLFAKDNFNYYLFEKEAKKNEQPRLVDMAKKALSVLKMQHNDNGFYLMIEGGAIDLAEHDNMIHPAAEELSEFSIAIEEIRKLIDEDTLIVVTADHAHALTLPGYVHKNNSIYNAEVEEPDMNVDGLPVPSLHFATGPGYNTSRNYTAEQAADSHFKHPAAYPTAWGAHGGEDVGIWAQGPYSWLFSGSIENTQVAYTIKFLLCLDKTQPNFCNIQNTAVPDALIGNIEAPGQSLSGGVVAVIVVLSLLALISALSTAFFAFLVFTRSNRRLQDSNSFSMQSPKL